jgi:hypothetical protein
VATDVPSHHVLNLIEVGTAPAGPAEAPAGLDRRTVEKDHA